MLKVFRHGERKVVTVCLVIFPLISSRLNEKGGKAAVLGPEGSYTEINVRANCYCASLVSTLFIGHARATSVLSALTESKKYRADGLCVNLVNEYF